MTIRSNVDTGTVAVTTSDTAVVIFGNLLNTSRYAVTNLTLFNTTGADITVDVYRSPNLTSASGDQIDSIVVSANDQEDSNGTVNVSPNSDNIICVASAVGVNATGTVITYGANE